jgi:diphosphomevalonate decarboxylase
MADFKATAVACPNIAFIKYWGNRDDTLRLPANGSISMNLGGLTTQTCVSFDPHLKTDSLSLNGTISTGKSLSRMTAFLNILRTISGKHLFAAVTTENNFPTGAGIASSASAYAALAMAASHALEIELDETGLSRLARRGSGSACRSVPGGFVEWRMGQSDTDSYAISIAPPEHWNLVDVVAVLQSERKPVGSSEGHSLAASSPLQESRLAGAAQRLDLCRNAIFTCDFEALSRVVEADSNLMHAVMMTSDPPLFYWQPSSLAIMKLVPQWRHSGLAVCYTLDAGPNVHLLCLADSAEKVSQHLSTIPGVSQVLQAPPGGPARIAEDCSLV